MTKPLQIAIAGASGRMGKTLIEAILNHPDCELAGAFDQAGSPSIGRDAGDFMGISSGVLVTDNTDAALSNADVLIDFTRPEGTLHHLALCEKHGVKAVIGTTGFEPKQLEALKKAAEKVTGGRTRATKEKSLVEEVTKNTMVRQVGRTIFRELTRGLLGALGIGKR